MNELHQKLVNFILCITLTNVYSIAHASVTLDRTRAIFNADSKSISLNISNNNNRLPYLAQAWLEDSQQRKIVGGALVVIPPIQRLEPGGKSMLRILATQLANTLPQDRESLFYLNLREIPPRSNEQNVLQIALQTRIKLFYRPKNIIPKLDYIWQEKLILHENKNGYVIENPTPYYITITGLGNNQIQSEKGKFNVTMLSPKSSIQIKSQHFKEPYLTYINDYGGQPTLRFICSGQNCTVKT
ncbi:molecular chaperone [Salmonella enterica]|nr:molecular chaperone [Salmonella enterica]EDG2430170.1 fimbria/pilus periplasmic chaperone [Salmonella enterica]EGM6456611.1 molecular chaperone [Salmonella enterica]